MNYEEQPIAVVLNPGEIIKRELTKIVNKLKKDETLAWAGIRVELKGRVNGDMKLEYLVYDNEYSPSTGVTSFNLQSASDELLRRRGFEKVNTPLMLTSSQVNEDDLPF